MVAYPSLGDFDLYGSNFNSTLFYALLSDANNLNDDLSLQGSKGTERNTKVGNDELLMSKEAQPSGDTPLADQGIAPPPAKLAEQQPINEQAEPSLMAPIIDAATLEDLESSTSQQSQPNGGIEQDGTNVIQLKDQ